MESGRKDKNDGKCNDDNTTTTKIPTRFEAAYVCANEECKKQNNGKEYELNTNERETQRKCPKCGTMNKRWIGSEEFYNFKTLNIILY